jgi:hypothetical protein
LVVDLELERKKEWMSYGGTWIVCYSEPGFRCWNVGSARMELGGRRRRVGKGTTRVAPREHTRRRFDLSNSNFDLACL